ncbi:M3 family oligoendopeptidase [Swaminathania salitolerans]|uniref:M3 family oligoendopeptidase n=1 Tax=Swaminathania salitolerans TaxID=182838 RepID=A0A511BPP5_9PROT|nr:M3 family oligoendopeptidase [Swaminathania salitolerans]GBQ11060.1 oligoendopeptidase F [Swaminathania salitolerans LMG 21291]GEL02287.1 M3 family oligoendopeptidase [Swaminathania salitolerans]
MITSFPDFRTLDFPTPERDALEAEYAAIHAAIDADDLPQALDLFDRQRRAYESWASLAGLRFSQDTKHPGYIAARDLADRLTPFVTGLETGVKRRFLERRDQAARYIDAYVLALWDTDITTFDDRIEPLLAEEARLCSEYTALLAKAEIPFRGAIYNLSGLEPFQQEPDRQTRHDADAARWEFYESQSAALDGIFDALVRLRTEMARTLGFSSYTELGYRRMRRTDYTPRDVAGFREQIATHVTPLVQALLQRRQLEMGWDRVKAWDEALVDPAGNPAPAGNVPVMLARAAEMFAKLDETGELAAFFDAMVQGRYLDLENRPGKADGGFCTSFPSNGTPFIFANFNGTHGDIGVFTHEMGHAYQNWKSRDLPAFDSLWPTMEAAEIHSMGLEFLSWPEIDGLVEEGGADRYRRLHLTESLCFLPYGACVDHFQHEIYARPDMSPAERHATWQRLERHYMPWRDWGDLSYPARGARWQAQRHIYEAPFYYIDYTLALCVALQLWLIGQVDAPRAMDIYRSLCAAGGSRPFCRLVEEAGLTVPFAEGALAESVDEAEQILMS